MLATVRHPASAPDGSVPLLIVHGLFGSARNWGAIARRLADRRDIGDDQAADQRGFGQGQLHRRLAAHGMTQKIDLTAKAFDHFGQIPGHRRVILDPGARAFAMVAHIHAMRGLDLTGLTSRGEADRRLQALVDDPALRAFFLQSLDLKAAGGPVWRLNLDVLERDMAKIIGWPGTEGHFDGPTLFLTGAESHYVRPEHRETIRALFPHARFAKLPGAGHWLQAEKPREFEETVRVFLNT